MTRFPNFPVKKMDSKRLIIFIVLSMGILLLWQQYFAPKPQPQVHRPKMDDPDDDDGPFVGEPPLTVRGSREMYRAAWDRISKLLQEKPQCENLSPDVAASLQVAS